MSGYQHNQRPMRLVPIALLVAIFLTSTTGHAQETEPGFWGKLFGGGDTDAGARSGSANIAWKAELPPGLYDGDYQTCVRVSGAQRLDVGSAVVADFGQPVEVTGAAVYVVRSGEEGDLTGEFSGKSFRWFFGLGKVSELGTQASARVSRTSPRTTSEVKFEITGVSGVDADVCLTEMEVYGSPVGEDVAQAAKTGLAGNWTGEYSNAGKKEGSSVSDGYGQKGNTVYRTYVVQPAEQTGAYAIASCYNRSYAAACGTETYSVSPEGKIHANYSYGMLGHWGGESDLKQVGPDEIRGKWNYRGRYGGDVVWRRAKPQVSRVVLSSDVADDFDPGKKPGRVEKTYDGYWWSSASDMRGNRPKFNIAFYGKNLWGRHDIRVSPQLDADNLILSDLEYRCCGEIKGPQGDVVGLSTEVIVWAGAVPGRKTIFIDDVPIPFDFVVHGHPANVEEKEDKGEPKLVGLRAMDKKGTATKGLIQGEVFQIEAVFDKAHPDIWIAIEVGEENPTVTLDMPLGEKTSSTEGIVQPAPDTKDVFAASTRITLWRAEDQKVFLSDWMVIQEEGTTVSGSNRIADYD